VRASAEVNKWPTLIDSAASAIGHSLVDEVEFVLAVLEHLGEIRFGHDEALERLLFLDDIAGELLQGGFVGLLDGTASRSVRARRNAGMVTCLFIWAMS